MEDIVRNNDWRTWGAFSLSAASIVLAAFTWKLLQSLTGSAVWADATTGWILRGGAAVLFACAAWHLLWLVLALLAQVSDSPKLRQVIRLHGTRVARRTIGVAAGFSLAAGMGVANASEPTPGCPTSTLFGVCQVATAQTSSASPETPSTTNEPQVSQTTTVAMNTPRQIAAPLPSSGTVPNSNAEPTQVKSHQRTYTIESGDTLWALAKAQLQSSNEVASNSAIWHLTQEIYRQNRSIIGENPNLIYPGTTITIDTMPKGEPK